MIPFWSTAWQANANLILSSNRSIVHCENEWCWDPGYFIDFDFWIALEGSGRIMLNGIEYPVKAGFSICFSPGDWKVSARHDPAQPLQVFYCHFDLQWPAQFKRLPKPVPLPAQLNTDPLLCGTVSELADSDSAARSPALQENLLWQLLLRTERKESVGDTSPQERVRTIIRDIKANPAMAPDMDDLARKASLSTGHFRRIFHHLTDMSPLEFIIRCRIDRAVYYLKETRLPIQQIASAVGYSDVFYFSRQFKQRTGKTPGAYRRQS